MTKSTLVSAGVVLVGIGLIGATRAVAGVATYTAAGCNPGSSNYNTQGQLGIVCPAPDIVSNPYQPGVTSASVTIYVPTWNHLNNNHGKSLAVSCTLSSTDDNTLSGGDSYSNTQQVTPSSTDGFTTFYWDNLPLYQQYATISCYLPECGYCANGGYNGDYGCCYSASIQSYVIYSQ